MGVEQRSRSFCAKEVRNGPRRTKGYSRRVLRHVFMVVRKVDIAQQQPAPANRPGCGTIAEGHPLRSVSSKMLMQPIPHPRRGNQIELSVSPFHASPID
jgi:hypothetical protein